MVDWERSVKRVLFPHTIDPLLRIALDSLVDQLFREQVKYASGPPMIGTWKRSDYFVNDTPSAGGYFGWVCVAGGTPGTWKGFGAIAV